MKRGGDREEEEVGESRKNKRNIYRERQAREIGSTEERPWNPCDSASASYREPLQRAR